MQVGDEYFFLEMNTRVQVEEEVLLADLHPLDLRAAVVNSPPYVIRSRTLASSVSGRLLDRFSWRRWIEQSRSPSGVAFQCK